MQTLDEVIDLYLQMETNYALMLNGEWGTGKTYYFKNVLHNRISQTPVFVNNKKKYKPILVSLFGLKSVEEIQAEIFLCLFPFLKDAKIKLGATVGRAVVKGILHLKGFGEYTKYVEEIDVKKSTLINFEELVICFDDIERISKNINIEEFIGYINSLVENENVKVLIIANEGKITAENYSSLKEKVIGNSIEFIPDINVSYDSIITAKFSSSMKYKEFLDHNKKFILEIFVKKSANLRTLIFTLNYFQRVYSEINNQLFKDNNLKEKQSEILLNLLKFSIAICIEYKEGKITFKKRNKLDIPTEGNWGAFMEATSPYTNQTNKKDKVESERELFIEAYYTDDKFYFYTSLYDYITGGTSLKYEKLIEELKRIYHIEENTIPPHYEIYNKLNYTSCFSLNNKDYLELTRKMLDYAYQGSYEITNYLSIFHFATRFGNPLNYNIDALEKRIIRGIEKGKKNYKYQDSLGFYLNAGSYPEYKDNISRIKEAILRLNDEILNETKTEEADELEQLCYSDFEAFSQTILDHQKSFYTDPIFSKFNPDEFYSFFYRSESNIRWEIVKFFTSRYGEYLTLKLKPEIAFLQKLKTRIEIGSKKLSGKNVSGFIYSEMQKQLEISIDRINTATY